MTHHILFSVEDDLTGPVMDGLLKTLQELGLEMIQSQQNGITLVSAVAVPNDEPPAEDPPATDDVSAEEPAAAEPEAVEAEVETPADEVEVELPVKFEGRLLSVSPTDTFECYASDDDVSTLPVADPDFSSFPGSVCFSMFGLDYKFMLDEDSCITATININGKSKKTKLKPVQALDELLEPFQLKIGKNDAELLTAEA